MKKAIKLFALAAVIVSMFAFSSCKKTEKLIVGEWQVSELKDIPESDMEEEEVEMMKLTTFTFNDDNTMKMNVAGMFSMNGTYDIDDDILNVTMEMFGEKDTESYKIKSISKKEMVWGDPEEKEPGSIILKKK